MPTPVKIKARKYGRAIGMLLERGGTFQTRHRHILIVNAEQRTILEEAGVVEPQGLTQRSGEKNGQQKHTG